MNASIQISYVRHEELADVCDALGRCIVDNRGHGFNVQTSPTSDLHAFAMTADALHRFTTKEPPA